MFKVIDNPTTKPLDGPEKFENFNHVEHKPVEKVDDVVEVNNEPVDQAQPQIQAQEAPPQPDIKQSVQQTQPTQQPTPDPSEPPQVPPESAQPTPIVQEPPTPQPAAMATPAHVPGDTPNQFQGSEAPQPSVNAESPGQAASVAQVEASTDAPASVTPAAEPTEVMPAVAAEGQPQPLSQPLAPPQPEVEQSSTPQPNLTQSSVPPPTDAVAQPPIEQTHQPVAAQSTEPQPHTMEVEAQQVQQPQPQEPQQSAESQPQQPQPVESEPQQPQPMDGQSVEAPQLPDEADNQPQPFDAPGVFAQDTPDGEDMSSDQPVVPPTPAGTEPIILPNGSKLPPRSAAFGIPAGPPFSFNQLKFVSSLVKQLKKMKAAVPFLSPVDYMSLGVPHYPEVISEPSDLGTVDRKVQKTIKAEEGGYINFNDWVTDIRRIFRNTEWFNGVEHPVSKMGRQVEESFDKQLKKMPPSVS